MTIRSPSARLMLTSRNGYFALKRPAHRGGFFYIRRRIKNYFTFFFGRFNEVFSSCCAGSSGKAKAMKAAISRTREMDFIVSCSRMSSGISILAQTISNKRIFRQPKGRL